MKAIVCVDKKWGIGKNNKMLFHLPEDLKFFKEKTWGKTVVMGYNTFLSLPNRKPLPNRKNIVLSRKKNLKIDGVSVVNSVEELLSILENDTSNVFLIGGEIIYKELLNFCDEAYVTKVNANGDAEKFFPNIDENPEWIRTYESDEIKTGNFEIKFNTYKRIKNL